MRNKFFLFTDCSLRSLGSALVQFPNNDWSRPLVVGYYGHSLSKAERNYHITKLELISVVSSIRHFGIYLAGQSFTIVTDHRPLKSLL